MALSPELENIRQIIAKHVGSQQVDNTQVDNKLLTTLGSEVNMLLANAVQVWINTIKAQTKESAQADYIASAVVDLKPEEQDILRMFIFYVNLKKKLPDGTKYNPFDENTSRRITIALTPRTF